MCLSVSLSVCDCVCVGLSVSLSLSECVSVCGCVWVSLCAVCLSECLLLSRSLSRGRVFPAGSMQSILLLAFFDFFVLLYRNFYYMLHVADNSLRVLLYLRKKTKLAVL